MQPWSRPLCLATIFIAASISTAEVSAPMGLQPPDARALLAAGLYEQAEAAARADVTGRRPIAAEDTPETDAVSDLLVSILVLNGRGASDEALTLAQRALRSKEARPAGASADLVPSLVNLADVLHARVQFDRSILIA